MSLELDRLIRDIVVWAADRAPPLSAEDLPPSVHVALSENADGDRIITITNQTTGVIRDETIRRVVPLNDLSFRVEAGNVRAIDSASGRARLAGTADRWATIQLPRLGVSDCIVLRTGGHR